MPARWPMRGPAVWGIPGTQTPRRARRRHAPALVEPGSARGRTAAGDLDRYGAGSRSRASRAATPARELSPSLASTLETCFSTVLSLRCSRAAICALVWPVAEQLGDLALARAAGRRGGGRPPAPAGRAGAGARRGGAAPRSAASRWPHAPQRAERRPPRAAARRAPPGRDRRRRAPRPPACGSGPPTAARRRSAAVAPASATAAAARRRPARAGRGLGGAIDRAEDAVRRPPPSAGSRRAHAAASSTRPSASSTRTATSAALARSSVHSSGRTQPNDSSAASAPCGSPRRAARRRR